jgi:hypothetical protein
MKTPGGFGKAIEMHDNELQSYRQDAEELYSALSAVIDAYFYARDVIPYRDLNERQCKAAFDAGMALGAHIKFSRTQNPQEV